MSALATSNIAAYLRWSSSKSRHEVISPVDPPPNSKSLPFGVVIAIISVGVTIACTIIIGVGYIVYKKCSEQHGYYSIVKSEED